MDVSLLINFGVFFIVSLILVSIFVFFARFCRILTVFFCYCFLASLAYTFAYFNLGATYFNFVEGLGSSLDQVMLGFSYPFSLLTNSFHDVILAIASFIVVDLDPVKEFLLTNLYLFIGLPGVFFLISAIFFRKKKKDNKNRSLYSD